MKIIIRWTEVGRTVPYDYDVFKRMVLLDEDGNAVKQSRFNRARLEQWKDEHHIPEAVDLTQEFEKKAKKKPLSTSKVGRFELRKLGVADEVE